MTNGPRRIDLLGKNKNLTIYRAWLLNWQGSRCGRKVTLELKIEQRWGTTHSWDKPRQQAQKQGKCTAPKGENAAAIGQILSQFNPHSLAPDVPKTFGMRSYKHAQLRIAQRWDQPTSVLYRGKSLNFMLLILIERAGLGLVCWSLVWGFF